MSKLPKLCRREVLLPGDLLPPKHRCAGKHHGVILRVEAPGAGPGGSSYPTATVQMTDFTEGGRTKRLKVTLPLEQVQPYVLARAATQREKKRLTEAEEDRLLGINYDFERWPSLDRQRAPKKPKRTADDPPLHGPQLLQRLQELEEAPPDEHFPPGTRVWVRVVGSGLWPGVAWAFGLCKRRDWGQLLQSHRPGMLLVRFYGEHSNMWVRPEDCELPPADEGEHLRQLRSVGRAQNKMRLLELALNELEGAHADPELERRRMVHLYEVYLQSRQAPDNCYLCRELGADLECCCCDRLFHPLCLHYPAVSAAELPGGAWSCPCCGEEQQVGQACGEEGGEVGEGGEGGEGAAGDVERMGLTPDWIIEAAAFRVFHLARPTAAQPFIAGLLDPCTNSKLAPNIPAEKLYDKQDNGLKLSNSWEGHFVLLNPDYRAQVQWRFVNRAIDEVENGQVPAVVLVCRNSTDTGYFQRLRPYPRVLLRRLSARFKDYDKTPIGFGIAVFCIAPKATARELYTRFYDAFESMGEPNIPVDRQIMQSDAFYALLDRLRKYAAVHHRDHWVQCTACSKWRIVDFQSAQQVAEDSEWTCSMLRPPFTSCQTPLSKNELVGGHYAAGGADWAGSDGEDSKAAAAKAEEASGNGAAMPARATGDEHSAEAPACEAVLAAAPPKLADGSSGGASMAEEEAAPREGASAEAQPAADDAAGAQASNPSACGSGGSREHSSGSGECSADGGEEDEGGLAAQQHDRKRQKVAGAASAAPRPAVQRLAEGSTATDDDMMDGAAAAAAAQSLAAEAAPISTAAGIAKEAAATAASSAPGDGLVAAGAPSRVPCATEVATPAVGRLSAPAVALEAGTPGAGAPAQAAAAAAEAALLPLLQPGAGPALPAPVRDAPAAAAAHGRMHADTEARLCIADSNLAGSGDSSSAGSAGCPQQVGRTAVKREQEEEPAQQDEQQAAEHAEKRKRTCSEAMTGASAPQEEVAGAAEAAAPPAPAAELGTGSPATAAAAAAASAVVPADALVAAACTSTPRAPEPVPPAAALPTIAEEGAAWASGPSSPSVRGAGSSAVETPVAASAGQRRPQPFSPRPGGCSSTSSTGACAPLLPVPPPAPLPAAAPVMQAALPLVPLPQPWQPADILQEVTPGMPAPQAQQKQQQEQGLPWKLRRRSAASVAAAAAVAKEEEEEGEDGVRKAPTPATAAPGLAPLLLGATPHALLPTGLASAGSAAAGMRPVFLMPLVAPGMQPCLPLATGSKPAQPPAAVPAQQQQQMAAYMRFMQVQALQAQAQAGAQAWPPLPLPMPPPPPMPLPMPPPPPMPLPVPAAAPAPQPLVQQVRPGDPIPPPPPLEWLLQSEQAAEPTSTAPPAQAAAEAPAAAEPADQISERMAQKQQQARAGKPPQPALPMLPKPRPKPPPLPPPPPPPVIPNPLPPASEVVCADTLRRLVCLPPRNLSLHPEEQQGEGQMLTALELARQARIAANRAYLVGLGLGPQAMNNGQVPPLAPNDPVMLAAARELATRAAEEQGRQQLDEVRRRYEVAHRRRQREEPRLLAALRELQAEEASAWQQLQQAERAAEDLQHEHELHMQSIAAEREGEALRLPAAGADATAEVGAARQMETALVEAAGMPAEQPGTGERDT
ncbi:hypothetical protein ABPG75_003211 [Micractinium tetrahymenae]